MRLLLPEHRPSVEPEEVYLTEREPPAGRPWVLVNMVTSLDGATAVGGRSGALGSPADRRVFHLIRSLADIILVGAATVRAEGYGPPRLDDRVQEARLLRGQAPLPRLAVVTSRLDLDLGAALITESDPAPIVVTTAHAPRARRVEVARVADLVLAGQGERIDLREAVGLLGELGASVVVCEGGASLNGQLFELDLVDELCLTLAPLVAVGASNRAAHGPELDRPLGFEPASLIEADGVLLLRALRTGPPAPTGAAADAQ
jgi:riboflavin-specific deaminase-like protein